MFAVADCTGHGVPGAMVSVICNSALFRSINEYGLIEPKDILDKTREFVISSFEDVNDGMDISFCSWNKKTNIIKFSGAYNPIAIIDNNELIELKGDRQPIGKLHEFLQPFTQQEYKLQKGSQVYLYSDGYADQFGGKGDKKFGPKKFRELLISIQGESMEEQKSILNISLKKWMKESNAEQIDDVCMIGIKI